jgi:DNA-binding transcriptional LysR family regulator
VRQINIGPAELETFLAVAARGSFSRAAEELGLSQPTVTGRIQRLEAVLGLALLSRTTRRVELTEAGERFRQRAEHTVLELRESVEHFHDEAALRTGRVSLTGTPAIAATVIPKLARRFLRRYPGIRMRLHEDFVLQGLQRLCDGEVDLAIVPVIEYSNRVAFEALFSDDFVLIVPRDHPLAREEEVDFKAISNYPLLTRPAGSALRAQLTDEFAVRGLPFKPALESTSLITLLGLVEAGLGISLLPAILTARLNMSAVSVVRVGDAGISRQIGIATLQGRALSPAATHLRNMLRSSYSTPRAGKSAM